MTDPAAPTPGGFPPPGPGQTSNPVPGQYPPPPPGGNPPPPPPPEAPGSYPPPPPYGAPPPAAAPPPKKGKALKIVLIVVGALVVLCGVGIFAAVKLIGNVVDQAYDVGNCLDSLPVTDELVEVTPVVVPCDSAEAQARIVEAYDGRTAAEGDELCSANPEAISIIELTLPNGDTRLLCLAEN